jgi:hypothetical protein
VLVGCIRRVALFIVALFIVALFIDELARWLMLAPP